MFTTGDDNLATSQQSKMGWVVPLWDGGVEWVYCFSSLQKKFRLTRTRQAELLSGLQRGISKHCGPGWDRTGSLAMARPSLCRVAWKEIHQAPNGVCRGGQQTEAKGSERGWCWKKYWCSQNISGDAALNHSEDTKQNNIYSSPFLRLPWDVTAVYQSFFTNSDFVTYEIIHIKNFKKYFMFFQILL